MRNKKNTIRIFIRLVPAIIWWGFTFYLLSLPGSSLPKIEEFDKLQIDKLVHVSMFGILTELFCLPFLKSKNNHFFLIITLLCFSYGIAMEFVQKYFIPMRSFDLWDMLADGIGCFIVFGWVIWHESTAVKTK